jgi:hypothetical protein
MVADGRLWCDSLLLCALFSIIYLVVISWAFVAGHFAAQPQGNETNGFFPLEPFLPFPIRAVPESYGARLCAIVKKTTLSPEKAPSFGLV